MSGVTATEYAAQVAAVTSPSRIPPSSRRTRRRPRRRRRARPRRNEIAAAAQKRLPSRSRPSASPNSAAKIGIVPMSRPIVDALVASSASTKQTWLSQSSTAVSEKHGDVSTLDAQRPLARTASTRRRSLRRARSEPSRTTAAASPLSRMYFVTLRFSDQSRIVVRSISSTEVGRRTFRRYPARVEPELAQPRVDGFGPAAVRGRARRARVRDAPDESLRLRAPRAPDARRSGRRRRRASVAARRRSWRARRRTRERAARALRPGACPACGSSPTRP